MSGLSVLQTTGMESTTHDNNKYNDKYNLSILFFENLTYHYDNVSSSTTSENSWLIILLDRSQQVMTIIGLVANIGTSITLIINGQVGTKHDLFCYH